MIRDTVDDLLEQWGRERPGLDVSALGVVVRLQHLGKLLGSRTNRALRRHGLKHWEYDVLSVLRRQGAPFELPSTEIARAVHLTSGAMTTRIDGLEERGLVARRQNDEDGRSILVRLTAAGLALIDLALKTRLEDANSAMAALPPDKRRRLSDRLRRMLADLEG